MNSRTILDLSAAALCGSLVVAIAVTTVRVNALIDTLAATTQALPGALDAAVTREGARLDSRLQSIERRADGRLAAIQRDLVEEVRATRKDLRQEIGGFRQIADERSLAVSRALDANLRGIASSVDRVSLAYAAVPGAVGARLDPWTDCRRGTCLQAQTLGMIGTFRATGAEAARVGRVAREAAPAITHDFAATTANVERITRPESWRWKVLRLVVPFLTGYAAGSSR